jgi:hypothetical protein
VLELLFVVIMPVIMGFQVAVVPGPAPDHGPHHPRPDELQAEKS